MGIFDEAVDLINLKAERGALIELREKKFKECNNTEAVLIINAIERMQELIKLKES